MYPGQLRLLSVLLLTAGLPLVLQPDCSGQESADYDLGGASRPRPQMTFRKARQYKRVHQAALRQILLGEFESTSQFLHRYLKNHPGDEETLYMLGLLNLRQERHEAALALLQQSLDAGLPPGRLLAGPRDILAPVWESPLLTELRADFRHRPVHGPLVGAAHQTSVFVWVRTADAAQVRLLVRESGASDVQTGTEVTATAVTDFTAVATVQDLNPGTQYDYAVQLNDGPVEFLPKQQIRTWPRAGAPVKFSIAFGGGAGFVPPNERMWDTIGSFDPTALLLLGDNVYIDDPESVLMQQYTYQRRQSRPEWRRLTARTPTLSIWDDHDFSTNDSWGGPQTEVPFWKKDLVFPTFRQNWANPGYAGGDDQPGCWYRFSIADVDFLMLDCRYYRTSPQAESPSMLGEVQLQWLQQQLADCQGRFVVLCSSVPWDYRTKGDSLDTWNGYRPERDRVFAMLEQAQLSGVVLLSADRHRSDAWKIDRQTGYSLYEFSSSRLTNQHVHPRMEQAGSLFSYNALQSFGLVTFDTTLADPAVTYDVINIDGTTCNSLTVPLSKLQHQSRSADRK